MGELLGQGGQRLGQNAGVGDHQRAVAFAVHHQLVLLHGRLFQGLQADDIVAEMLVEKCLGGDLGEHIPALVVHPLTLGVVEDGAGGDMLAAVEEVGDLIGILHQMGEALKLGIMPLRAEVGRAVGVGVVGGEGMGDEVVDAAHQEEVGDPLHHGTALGPAVCTELLAHGAALHLRVLVSQGCPQLTQDVVVEGGIADTRREAGVVDVVGHAGHDLVEDDVDTRHVLTLQCAEVVTRARGHSGVAVEVLDDVADVHDPVVAAPVTQEVAEIIAVEAGDGIHVGQADGRGVGTGIPQLTHVGHGGLTQLLVHHGGDTLVVGQSHAHGAEGSFVAAGVNGMAGGHAVAEGGLVREEAHEGIAEILGVMLEVRLVDRLDLHHTGFKRGHVDVIVAVAPTALGIDEDAVDAFRDVPVGIALGNGGGEIHVVPRDVLSAVSALTSEHAQDLVVGQHLADQEGGIGGGAQHVDMLLDDLPLAEMGVLLPDEAVGVARGETLIVQHPDLHIPLLALGEDDVHIGPPIGAAEIGMGTGFHAEGAAAALKNALYLGGDAVAVGTVLPVEGQEIVVLAAKDDVFKAGIFHGRPPDGIFFIIPHSVGKVNAKPKSLFDIDFYYDIWYNGSRITERSMGMPDLTSLMRSSVLSYGHLSVITDMKGEERAVYLGYSLPLSKAELLLLKTILLSLPVCLSTNEIAEATGISAGQISVLVNRINRKASAIGNRKLILGTSHHGFQLNEFM